MIKTDKGGCVGGLMRRFNGGVYVFRGLDWNDSRFWL